MKLRNQSAIVIQTTVQHIILQRQFIDLLSWNRRISNQSASAIQSILRGKLTSRMYMQQIQQRQSAINNIQRVFRGNLGQEEYHRLRYEKVRQQHICRENEQEICHDASKKQCGRHESVTENKDW